MSAIAVYESHVFHDVFDPGEFQVLLEGRWILWEGDYWLRVGTNRVQRAENRLICVGDCTPGQYYIRTRGHSSVWLEQVPDKDKDGGSNPPDPTIIINV